MSTILILNAVSSAFAGVGLMAWTIFRRNTRTPVKVAFVPSTSHGAPGASGA